MSEEWAAKFSLKKPHSGHSHSCAGATPSRIASFPVGDAIMLTGMGTLLDSESSSTCGDGGAADFNSLSNSRGSAGVEADVETGLRNIDAAAAVDARAALTAATAAAALGGILP